MPINRTAANRNVYQGSGHSYCDVHFYSTVKERSVFAGLSDIEQQSVLRCYGETNSSNEPSVISVVTSNSLGTTGGSFQIEILPGKLTPHDLRNVLFEDDWVDIVFWQNNEPFHAYRGIVDTVLRNVAVQQGATRVSYTITGQGFGKPFAATPLWFDRFSDGDYTAAAAQRLFNGGESNLFLGAPNDVTRAILFAFLGEIRKTRRALWPMPDLPGEPSTTFGHIVQRPPDGPTVSHMWDDTAFTNEPKRRTTFIPSGFNPENGNLWSVAQQWADPLMCEMYCELGPVKAITSSPRTQADPKTKRVPEEQQTPGNRYLTPGEPVQLGSAAMRVYFRDIPFPVRSRDGRHDGSNSPYYKDLPNYVVSARNVVEERLARSGIDRKNAFFVTPQTYQELYPAHGAEITRALILRTDIEQHGLRRLDAGLRYSLTTEVSGIEAITKFRELLFDFHCLNPLYLSGQITFRPGLPDLRIGTKLTIVEEEERYLRTTAKPLAQTTYYVEGVEHRWTRPAGLVTTATVTRGWRHDAVATELGIITARRAEAELLEPAAAPASETNAVPSTPLSGSTDFLQNEDYNGDGGYFPPYSEKLSLLLEAAVPIAQIYEPAVELAWARDERVHYIIAKESQGYVGRPTAQFCATAGDPSTWPEIWRRFRAGEQRWTKFTATGLGQLIRKNVETYYPNGLSGVGVPIDEAVGMLRYIADKFGSVEAAYAYKLAKGTY